MNRNTILLLAAVTFTAAPRAMAQAYITTLASFTGPDGNGADGELPDAGLTADSGGNLYGTTSHGGVYGFGTVFEVAVATQAVSTLASFNGTNGEFPVGGVITDAAGNVYGTTEENGPTGHYGLVFKLAAGTQVPSTLVTFNNNNGATPAAGLIADASGNLYGTTEYGFQNNGTVFEVAAGTHSLTTLAIFNGTSGANPEAGLIADTAGNLYGTTTNGGASDDGAVFEVAAGTHALSAVAMFNGANGEFPIAGLISDATGNLYGTTQEGGANGDGTVFEVAAGTHVLSDLASFNGTNGDEPAAGLIADAAGNLYGTTWSGGANNLGTVFELTAGTHDLSTLISFNSTNGARPAAGLIADASGNLYGTTYYGGANGASGTVFELSGTGFVTSVPEPTSLSLLGLAAPVLLVRRRNQLAYRK